MNSQTRMTSSEAFVETLVAHGVRDIFGIAGSAYMDAMDLFPAAGIRLVSVAHESPPIWRMATQEPPVVTASALRKTDPGSPIL